MRKYVVYKERYGRERYWTGDMTPIGSPRVSSHTYEAVKFDTPGEAYECADKAWKSQPKGDNVEYLARFRVGKRQCSIH